MSYLEMALKVSRKQQEESPAQEPSAKSRPPLRVDVWPSASLDAERRFGQPHAKLFPFIGCKVRTPAGVGMLVQVFAERVTVLLDSELSRCSLFRPTEIEPVSSEP
jgi:hypothetical protein